MIKLLNAFAAGSCMNSAIWSAFNGSYFIATAIFAIGAINAFAAVWWRYE